jgi:transcriptional regulator with XRE-family HTH domain
MSSTLPERLRLLRGVQSQFDFARKLGVKQTSYSGWETRGKDPGASVIAKISTKLGISADWILGLVDDAQTPFGVSRIPQEVEEKINQIKILESEITRLKGENAGLRHALEVVTHTSK